jgi:hypothetical protein
VEAGGAAAGQDAGRAAARGNNGAGRENGDGAMEGVGSKGVRFCLIFLFLFPCMRCFYRAGRRVMGVGSVTDGRLRSAIRGKAASVF